MGFRVEDVGFEKQIWFTRFTILVGRDPKRRILELGSLVIPNFMLNPI